MSTDEAAYARNARPALPVVDVVLHQHLTAATLKEALDRAARSIGEDARVDVIVDCRSMTGYDLEARTIFVDWNSRMRASIAHLAVLTDKPLWRLVVSGMALASRQNMKPFSNRAEAVEWFAT